MSETKTRRIPISHAGRQLANKVYKNGGKIKLSIRSDYDYFTLQQR